MNNLTTSMPYSTVAFHSTMTSCANVSYALSSSSAPSIELRQKTPAEVAGEYLLKPLVERVKNIWNWMSSISFGLPVVHAEYVYQEHTYVEGQNKPSNIDTVSKTKWSMQPNPDALKISFIEEMASNFPNAVDSLMRKIFKEGNNWVDKFIAGGEFVLDVLGISQPYSEIADKMNKLEKMYWMRAVKEKYEEIFDYIPGGYYRPNTDTSAYEIKYMRDSMASKGYSFDAYGTPLQYLEFLKKSKICYKTTRNGC